MLKRLNKRNGNRFTLLSIVLIILMAYFFRIALGGSEADYPQYVYYKEYRYEYSQTINESSIGFVRKYGVSYEGKTLLLKRGESGKETPDKVYLFTGWRKYREYKLAP